MDPCQLAWQVNEFFSEEDPQQAIDNPCRLARQVKKSC